MTISFIPSQQTFKILVDVSSRPGAVFFREEDKVLLLFPLPNLGCIDLVGGRLILVQNRMSSLTDLLSSNSCLRICPLLARSV